jgi:hypothetical protein
VIAFVPGRAGGIWFPVSLAGGGCWYSPVGLSGAAWSIALTARSSGRVRVTPSRRRAEKPWARLPITVAAAWCRVTFSYGVLVSPRAGVGGVDREQADAVPAGLRGKAVAEHRRPRPIVSRPTVRASAKSRSSTAMVVMPWRAV